MDEQFAEQERRRLRMPAISLLIGQSMSGKSTLAAHLLRNWSEFFDGELEKVTIFSSAEISKNADSTFMEIPVKHISKHFGLSVENLSSQKLSSPDGGHSLVIFEDQLQAFLVARGDVEASLRDLIIRGMHHEKVRADTFERLML